MITFWLQHTGEKLTNSIISVAPSVSQYRSCVFLGILLLLLSSSTIMHIKHRNVGRNFRFESEHCSARDNNLFCGTVDVHVYL